MQSKSTTVKQYLAELPEDRRKALEAVRKVFLANLDKDIEEGMSYGMIGYNIPHRVYPPGYHCNPAQPLPYAGLASQKGHMSLYLSCTYGAKGELDWFVKAWKATGKKLDMGKACIRFKRVEDLALDVLAQALRRTSAKAYIAHYESEIRPRGGPSAEKKAAGPEGRKKTTARTKASAPKESTTAKKAAAPKKTTGKKPVARAKQTAIRKKAAAR